MLPPLRTGFGPVSPGITPALSLLRAHAPDLSPLTASVLPLYHESLQVAARPCWKQALPDVNLRIFLSVLGPIPRLLSWCTCPFLPKRQRPSRKAESVGATVNLSTATSVEFGFSGLQSFDDLQAR